MSSKQASRLIVVFTVAFLMTGSLISVLDHGDDQGRWGIGPVAGTLGNYTASKTGLPTDGDYYFLKFADVNDDGYDDIVAGAGQYQGTKDAYGIHVYTWKPSTSRWEANSTGLPTTGYFAGLDVGDVDGDGDLDVVAGGEGWAVSPIKGCRVYVNNGTSGGKIDWDEVTGPDTSAYYDQVKFADVNDDGDLDIVAATADDGIRCWVGNGGSGGTFTWTAKNSGLLSSGEYTGVAVADMNKDGDLDIVVTDYSGTSPAVRLFTGDGTGSWTSQASSMPSDNSQSFGVAVGDVDKDGNMDIVYSRNYGLRCYLGNGGGTGGTSFTWTAANTNLATSSRHAEMNLADLDKDGDLDIVVAVVDGGVVAYLGNGGAGSGQSWTKASVKLPTTGRYYGAAVGDFNGDGVLDVGGAMWEDGGSAGGLYAWQGSVQNDEDPTAEATWYGTAVNETTALLTATVQLDGRNSSDPQDAPTGDSAGTALNYEWNFTVVPGASSITDASLSPGDDDSQPSFTPDRTGVYRLSLTVQDTAGNWSPEVFVKLDVMKPNEVPVADAGEDQVVTVGAVVELNSSGSYDTDGAISAWQWNASASNPSVVTLTGATLPVASFVAPSTTGEYIFELTVRDDNLTWSEADEVMVNITLPTNVPPVAVAPNDFVTTVLELTALNGSSSYDNDGTIVAWDWNCTSHPSLPMTGSDTMVASFTPALAVQYTFTLTVQDNRGAWSPEDSVTVTVQEKDVNVPPVADIAGAAVRNAYLGDDVILDGSPSHDDDGTIEEYVWNCTSHPGLSFTGQNTTTVEFRPAEEGDHVFTLAVRDDNGTWSVVEDSVTVHVTMAPVNSPPEAVIDGPIVKVRPNDDVVLDGSRSSDRDGVIVTFDWRCISHPTLEFNGQNTSFITFTVEDVGDYTFTLTVVDNLGTECDEPAYHTVYVKTNVLPVATVTGPMMGLPGINYTLSAATSSDEDGEVVQWKWNCTSHPGLNITGVENETMTFNAPASDDYVFRLVVWDDEGATSQATEWTVEINPIDEPPRADAGIDKQVRIGGSVELNGAASEDYEGEIVAWLWRCTSHTNVPGLVNADQMLASFTPPEPGTFVFSLEVQDEAGQWSEPDEVIITVLEQNSEPEVTVISPTANSIVTLDQHMLVIRWDTYDANGDSIMFKVEIWKVDDGEVFLARKGNLPYGTNNVTFNATNFNFPRGVDLEARILAWETNTEDGYNTLEVAGPFQIKKDQAVHPDGGGGDDEGLGLNYILIGVVVFLALLLVGWMIMRGGSEDDEVPWEDEASEAPRSSTRSALAEHMPTAPSKPGPQTLPAAEAASQPKRASKTDPKGRLLDCPECGAPLDHDTDFGAPYCWDCDKYF